MLISFLISSNLLAKKSGTEESELVDNETCSGFILRASVYLLYNGETSAGKS